MNKINVITYDYIQIEFTPIEVEMLLLALDRKPFNIQALDSAKENVQERVIHAKAQALEREQFGIDDTNDFIPPLPTPTSL